MKTVVIIPARAGSKGIPQKNIRFLNGKPLLYYAINTALQLDNARVYVSTDSHDIAHIAEILGARTLIRDRYSDDDSTLDQVISYEIEKLSERGEKYETVITLQPTSPLLRINTLRTAVSFYQKNNLTSLISATPRKHLSWIKDNDNFYPMYEKRVNRQQLTPIYEENGAFLICQTSHVLNQGSRISKDIKIFEIDEAESVDIDSQNDWILAENILKRRNIAIVTNGNTTIGMGHIYRSLTLSSKFSNDNVFFFSNTVNRLGIQKLTSLNYEVTEYSDDQHLILLLMQHDIQLVINDTLDTNETYMKSLKEAGFFVVNFEDTGRGANHADLVINALYEWSNNTSENYYGYQYEVLREDIYLYPVKSQSCGNLKNILVGFGGTDPENATIKILEALVSFLPSEIQLTVVLGVGYQYEAELNDFLSTIDASNIHVIKDVYAMADYLYKSDLVISGNGRMVYETVGLGIPLIAISQNEREMSHIFPRVCKGVGYLGYIKTLDFEKLETEVLMLMRKEYCQQVYEEIRDKAFEIRQGVNRVINLINQRYDDARQ